MLKYNICFIRRKDEVLLVNRQYPSWMGSWNGVGGKLDQGEIPRQSVIREVFEETGIELQEVFYKGAVTWVASDGHYYGGMYVYLAEVADDFEYPTPLTTSEGILDWKKIDWVLHPENLGVAKNIPKFLPSVLDDPEIYNHMCTFKGDVMVGFTSLGITPDTEHNVNINSEWSAIFAANQAPIRPLQSDEQLPLDLLLLADPDENVVEGYVQKGQCYIYEEQGEVIGEYVLLPTHPGTIELINVAVAENCQGRGIGKQLVLHAVQTAKEQGYSIIEVGTGNSGIGQLHLYQRCGFRITGIDTDFFVRNYSEPIMENGMQCCDMIRLSQVL